jgi:hypothetical protein
LIFAISGNLITCANVPARSAKKAKFYMDLWALLGAFYATLEATKTVAGGSPGGSSCDLAPGGRRAASPGECLGQKGAYTRAVGPERETNKALLLKHVNAYSKVGANRKANCKPCCES